MKTFLIWLICRLFFSFWLYGQTQLPHPDLYYQQSAGASITHRSRFSYANHPAAFLTDSSFQISMVQVAYSADYSVHNNALGLKWGKSLFTGLWIQSFGNHVYRSTMVGISMGKRLSPHFSLGITAKLLAIPQESGGYRFRLNPTIGGLYHGFGKWHFSGLLDSPFTPFQILKCGITYQFLPICSVSMATHFSNLQAPTKHISLNYQVKKDFFVSVGARLNPSLSSLGFVLPFKNWVLEAQGSFAEFTGFSTGLALHYAIR